MSSKKSLLLIAVLGLLVFAGHATAGPNANAVLSLDLIADGGAGNRTDDGVTSGAVSGPGHNHCRRGLCNGREDVSARYEDQI